MFLKGQSSVEFVMVVGMALLMSSPFIFASQSSIIELDDANRLLSLDRSLQELESVAVELNGSSWPARETVEFKTPGKVENVYNPSLSSGSALVFEVRSKEGVSNRSMILDFELVVDDTERLGQQGFHDLSVRKASDQVNVSVIS